MTVTREEFEKLRAKVAEHEARLKDTAPVVAEHEDRLDSHDATLSSLERTVKHVSADVADVKRSLLILSGGLDRIFAAVTPLLLSSENTNKVLSQVARQVEALHTKLGAARG